MFPQIYERVTTITTIDKIPKTISELSFVVINTATQLQNGKHWICLHRTIDNNLELFDSLGTDSEKEETIRQYVRRPIFVNITPVQEAKSKSCGLFVIFYIFHRFFDHDIHFNDFLSTIFSSNTTINEERVKSFMEEHAARN